MTKFLLCVLKKICIESTALAACLCVFSAHAAFTIPAEFDVGPDGAATYTVPIQVPPGTAGIEPVLELKYSSNVGNGKLGVGWTVVGLSQISRCPKTIAQDGGVAPVKNTNSDAFCLDGQKLIAIGGGYGADGTEYRTEIDLFTKIVSYGTSGTGPSWFKVWTKSGQTIEYGNTADSRIEVPNGSTARQWNISRKTDQNGNYLTYAYVEDNPNGENYISRIDYTGNDKVAPKSAPYASVRFSYVQRTDPFVIYSGGVKLRTSVIVSKIETYNSTDLVRSYKFEYQSGAVTKRSILSKFSECGSSGLNCHSTIFKIAGSPATSYPVIKPYTLASKGMVGVIGWGDIWMPYILPADFNGDGCTDVLAPMNPSAKLLWSDCTGGVYSTNAIATSFRGGDWFWVHAGDFNGDGCSDLYVNDYYSWDHNSSYANLLFSDCKGSFVNKSSVTNYLGINFGNFDSLVGDFNGDGCSDLFLKGANANHVMLSDCNGGFVKALTFFGNYKGVNWNKQFGDYGTSYHLNIGDFNGDKCTDIFLQAPYNTKDTNSLMLSDCHGDFNQSLNFVGDYLGINWEHGGEPYWNDAYEGYVDSDGHMLVMGDFNGDQCTDVILSPRGSLIAAGLFLSKCDGTFEKILVSNTPFSLADTLYMGSGGVVGDFNGDHCDDVFVERSFISMSNCDGSFRKVDFPYSTLRYGSMQIAGDLLGNGVAQVHFLRVNGEEFPGAQNAVEIPSGTASEELIASIEPMFGANKGQTISITYAPIGADCNCYTKDTGTSSAIYPNKDYQGGIRVVTSVETNDSGNKVLTKYSYAGYKINQAGRGALGFRMVRSTSADSGADVVTYRRQDFPLTGLKSETDTWRQGKIESTENFSFSCRDPQTNAACVLTTGSRVMPLLNQSAIRKYELDGTLTTTTTTTYQYDDFGNVAQRLVDFGGGYNEKTDYIYLNDTSKWIFGKPLRETTTNTSP